MFTVTPTLSLTGVRILIDMLFSPSLRLERGYRPTVVSPAEGGQKPASKQFSFYSSDEAGTGGGTASCVRAASSTELRRDTSVEPHFAHFALNFSSTRPA